MTPGWLTRQQAAQRAGVHYNTIRIWERSGLIRTQKHGARGVLSAEDLDRVVRERGAAAPSAPASAGADTNILALERRFEVLLDGLERLVASARTAQPRRRRGRPLGSRNKPKPAANTSAGRKPAKRSATRSTAKRSAAKRTSAKRSPAKRSPAKRSGAKRSVAKRAGARRTRR